MIRYTICYSIQGMRSFSTLRTHTFASSEEQARTFVMGELQKQYPGRNITLHGATKEIIKQY